MKLPNHIALANLPTRIEYLSRFSKEVGAEIYIKRDDFTGGEDSGNKMRKLEFAVQEDLDKCWWIQIWKKRNNGKDSERVWK